MCGKAEDFYIENSSRKCQLMLLYLLIRNQKRKAEFVLDHSKRHSYYMLVNQPLQEDGDTHLLKISSCPMYGQTCTYCVSRRDSQSSYNLMCSVTAWLVYHVWGLWVELKMPQESGASRRPQINSFGCQCAKGL